MRRSTAAAVGTVAGAALIIGVRLSVSTPVGAPPPAVDLANNGSSTEGQGAGKASSKPSARPSGRARDRSAEPSRKPSRPPADDADEDGGAAQGNDGGDSGGNGDGGDSGGDSGGGDAGGSGLTNGTFNGRAVSNPYGTVQVTIRVSGGEISAVDATYPANGASGAINNGAVPKLKAQTLQAQSAEVDTVSGATFTSRSYAESLQAALDAAGA